MLTAVRKPGATLKTCVAMLDCWALRTSACDPAQRAKKSDSAPAAFSVSIICRPAIVVPVSLPASCRKRRWLSMRRVVSASTRRLTAAIAMLSSVSGRLYWIMISA